MEWLEIRATTVEGAKEQALVHLGVDESDAEFEVLSEPRMGLFGRVKQEARVRARVLPTPVRPKDSRGRGHTSRPVASLAAPLASSQRSPILTVSITCTRGGFPHARRDTRFWH